MQLVKRLKRYFQMPLGRVNWGGIKKDRPLDRDAVS